ncbi:MAG: 3-deoxy-D-manno-octulosonic acid kinase [Nevskiaceae bacterium]
MKTEYWRQGAHHVLHDSGALPQPRAELFDPAYWQAAGRVEGRAEGRGSVVFVRGGLHDEVLALRHYRRGGQLGRIVEDSYLWLGLRHTRPWREFSLTRELYVKGLPVPRPMAAHVERRGLLYRADLLTVRIAGAEPLADVLMAQALPASHWDVLGRTLKRFHAAGVLHGDINARNVLRDARGLFHVIDFDKALLLPSGPWQAQNLARFRRSLDKFKAAHPAFHFTEADWQSLLAGYSG